MLAVPMGSSACLFNPSAPCLQRAGICSWAGHYQHIWPLPSVLSYLPRLMHSPSMPHPQRDTVEVDVADTTSPNSSSASLPSN